MALCVLRPKSGLWSTDRLEPDIVAQRAEVWSVSVRLIAFDFKLLRVDG